MINKISDKMKKLAKIVEKSPKVRNEFIEVTEKLGKTKNKLAKALESSTKVKTIRPT